MSTFKARGIVLREVNFGEADKILTILFKDYGKVSVTAKSARRIKSKLISASTLFCYADYIIYTGGKYLSISQADVIEDYYNLRNDLDSLAYATFFLELVDKTVLDEEPVNDILLLLIKCLQQLTKFNLPQDLVARIFELKFLMYQGYTPQTNNCIYCNNKNNNIYFSSEGVICSRCYNNNIKAIPISPTTLYTINYILYADISELFNFKVSEDTLKQLKEVTQLLFSTHISVKLRSYEFIKTLKLY